MVQEIDTGGDFGSRMGRAIGGGLSASLPKASERYRLAKGLEDLGNQKGKTPFEQFASLASIPGITPQMLASATELLKQQNLRNAYRGGGARGQGEEFSPQQNKGAPSIRDVEFARMPNQAPSRSPARGEEQIVPQDAESPRSRALEDQPMAAEHPGAEKFLPAHAWTQEMQDQAISEAFDTGKAYNINEAFAYADKKREMYENSPLKERERLKYKKEIDNETNQLFQDQLKKRLHAADENEVLRTIDGDLQLKISKQAQSEVAKGNMTPKEAADYYSSAALDLAKDQQKLREIANRDFVDMVMPSKKAENIKRLNAMSNNFSKMGASEAFYNYLKDSGTENGVKRGLGLSPGNAALIAYPPSKNVASVVENFKYSKSPVSTQEGRIAKSREAYKLADEVLKNMNSGDSILAIARMMRNRDPNFDESAFFDYVRDNPQFYDYNPRLIRETETGVSDVIPNWGDMFLFPAIGKSAAERTKK